MLFSVSVILIFFISSLVVFYTYIKRKTLPFMTGMIISMTNAMMTSVAFGTILGIFIKDKDITLPTILSVSMGMFVGYVTGRPISIITSLEGITAGIMGGMMGAMLGVMIQPTSTEVIICFIDVIYLSVNLVLLCVIDEETNSFQNDTSKKIRLLINFLLLIALLVFLGILVLLNINFF